MINAANKDKNLTLVLSGGGALGALQIGALYALQETGYQPDMVVGVSIGAVNASFLALTGFSKISLDNLKSAWIESMHSNLLPSNYIWLALKAMLRRSSSDPAQTIKDFFIAKGMKPELQFKDLRQPRLVIVSSDLNSAEPVLHGLNLEERVLDSLLISTALPPWFMPVQADDHYLIDGGLVSNLPVEPAVRAGASHIIALDLMDARGTQGFGFRLPEFLDKLTIAPEKRQLALELELAAAHGIPTDYLGLSAQRSVPFWDFSHTPELIEQGYQTMHDWLEKRGTESENSTPSL